MGISPSKTVRIWRYELPGQIPALKTLNDEIHKLPEFTSLEMKSQYALELAIEEIVSNTIKYGYDDESIHHIILEVIFCGQRVDVRITDDGRKFNPIASGEPLDIPDDIDDLPIGGVGLMLAKEFVKDMKYDYVDENNVLEFSIY